NEEELVVDPELFEEIGRRWSKVGRVETELKAGPYDNELSRFRYDVTLRIDAKEEGAAPPKWVVWDEAGRWEAELGREVACEGEESVGLRGVQDGRVAQAVAAVRLLESAEGSGMNAGQVRAACGNSRGADPDAVMRVGKRLGVPIHWQGFTGGGGEGGVLLPPWG